MPQITEVPQDQYVCPCGEGASLRCDQDHRVPVVCRVVQSRLLLVLDLLEPAEQRLQPLDARLRTAIRRCSAVAVSSAICNRSPAWL